jgi:predicted  nucleic acid-binding Zn-ribbon protein
MKRQVTDLMTVQELDAQLEKLGALSRPEHELAAAEALPLRAERARLAKGLGAQLLERYDRLRQRYPRAVVETRRGVCLGCHTKRPTSMASRAAGFDTCERCGRILIQAERIETASTASTPRPATSAAVGELSSAEGQGRRPRSRDSVPPSASRRRRR